MEGAVLVEKPIQGSSMVPYLSLEVATEILAKCPVKTLLKFRVVCKLWYSLISSHQFVRRHLSFCANRRPKLFMIRNCKLYDLRYHDSTVLEATSIDIPIGGQSCFCTMACDGLIWVKEEFSGKMLLWNPSTRDSKMIPSISQVGVVHVEGRGKEWKYGFGYDCNSDDYKVLTLLPDKSLRGRKEFCYKSIMYTLRTNSWRWIQNSPRATWLSDTTSTFVSGALHWRASVYKSLGDQNFTRDEVIVSFDLATETYMEVPLPQDVGVSSEIEELGASRGCLCLLARDKNESNYDIWVMKEYGVPESWTKAVKIPKLQDIYILKPMTWFVEDGEILLILGNKLGSYNPDKDSIRYFATDDDGVEYCFPSCVSYEESLISPNAYSNIDGNEISHLNIKIGHAIAMRKEEKEIINGKKKVKKAQDFAQQKNKDKKEAVLHNSGVMK